MNQKMFKKPFMTAGFLLLVLSFSGAVLANVSLSEKEAKGLKPVEYNRDQLVKQAAIGVVSPPGTGDPPYRINPDGDIFVLPGTGSITYNFKTGDSAVNLAGDHVEPAISLYNTGSSGSRSSWESGGLNLLSCIGNRVQIITGEAKGERGWVIGKHGGAEHVMVDFSAKKVFEKLVIGDKMQVYTMGVGLELTNVKGVKAMNASPELIDALNQKGMIGITDGGKLYIAVAHQVPAKIMGSGLGRSHVYRGDYDIQMFDEGTVKEYGLDTLRFGDIIAIIDADHTYGRIYRKGAISVGVISHSTSKIAGHGPGVTSLFSSAKGNIEFEIDPNANLAKILGIR